jgi:predicted alpha/beta-fold hydrolase
LAKIRLPTLILHARDDPLVPLAPFLRPEACDNPNVLLVLLAMLTHGGHVGFIWGEGKAKRFSAEGIIAAFFPTLLGPLTL